MTRRRHSAVYFEIDTGREQPLRRHRALTVKVLSKVKGYCLESGMHTATLAVRN